MRVNFTRQFIKRFYEWNSWFNIPVGFKSCGKCRGVKVGPRKGSKSWSIVIFIVILCVNMKSCM